MANESPPSYDDLFGSHPEPSAPPPPRNPSPRPRVDRPRSQHASMPLSPQLLESQTPSEARCPPPTPRISYSPQPGFHDIARPPPISNDRRMYQTPAAITVYAQPVHPIPQAPPYSSRYLCLSCFVTLFCFVIFGLIAFVQALKSHRAALGGKYEEARKYSRQALYLNVAGILVGAVIIVTLVATLVET